MASKDLLALDKAILEVILDSPGAWRKRFSDIKTHVVTMDKKTIIEQCWEEMSLREGYKSINAFRAVEGIDIERLEKAIVDNVPIFLKQYKAKVDKAVASGQRNKYMVELLRGADSATSFTFSVSQPESETGDIFNYIKGWKADPQRPLLKDINAWAEAKSRRGVDVGEFDKDTGKFLGTPEERELNKKIGTKTGRKGIPASKTIRKNDSFADFGHVGESAVGMQRALTLADFLQTMKKGSGADAAAKKLLQSMEDIFGFKYSTTTNYGGMLQKTLKLILESSRANKNTYEKGEITSLELLVAEALDKVEQKGKDGKMHWVMQEGSDSFFNMAEKEVVANLVSDLTGNKKAKIITKVNWKNRKSGKSPEVKGKQNRRRVTNLKGPKYKKPKLGKRSDSQRRADLGTSSPSMEPLALIGMINKELPDVVESNMGRPRLESRTGRLAESARVTDIISTPQGFPSIGYTYQLSPYQTFETGGKQGNIDYDPRRLIDQSLRQIAMKFAMGRFYTRREQ